MYIFFVNSLIEINRQLQSQKFDRFLYYGRHVARRDGERTRPRTMPLAMMTMVLYF